MEVEITEEYVSEKVIQKLKEQYSEEKSKEIYQKSKKDIFEEIDIICKQTGAPVEQSLELYLQNNANTVSAICSFFDIKEKKKSEIKKNDIQNKLDQLRVIANDKDQCYDNLKKKKP